MEPRKANAVQYQEADGGEEHNQCHLVVCRLANVGPSKDAHDDQNSGLLQEHGIIELVDDGDVRCLRQH